MFACETFLCETIWTGARYCGHVVSWDVSQVQDFAYLFCGSTITDTYPNCDSTSRGTFNESVSGWNTAGATSMKGMFMDNKAFSQPVNFQNTLGVTDMSFMFKGATRFDGDVSALDTRNVTTMESMF